MTLLLGYHCVVLAAEVCNFMEELTVETVDSRQLTVDSETKRRLYGGRGFKTIIRLRV